MPKTVSPVTFAELGLTPTLLNTLSAMGFEKPTAIQEKAIPLVLQGLDVCASAQTGSGKTAAFLLPLIDTLMNSRVRASMPRVIVLSPTRELAAQVMENFKSFAKGTPLRVALLVGGEWMNEQEKQLKRRPDIIIATPGRLLDVIERGKLIAHDIKTLVIDEADRMLDMGFMPDVERLLKIVPGGRQIVLFSATFPPELKGLIDSILVDAKRVESAPTSSTVTTIKQFKIKVTQDQKRSALRAILRENEGSSAIVFCNRKKDVDIVAKSLAKHGFMGIPIHGDLPQKQRNETLERFRNEKGLILVASDVAARGIDVDDMPLVVNFDLPVNSEDYIHRIGRTGRAGRTGLAYTLLTDSDKRKYDLLKKLLNTDLEEYSLTLEEEVTQPRRVRETSREASSREGSPREGSPRETGRSRTSSTSSKYSRERDQYIQELPDYTGVGFGSTPPAFMRFDPSAYFKNEKTAENKES